MRFTKALARLPGRNYADGLTSGEFGVPSYELALHQHRRYCEALERCGVRVTILPADEAHADSTFVEDTAILIDGHAVLTRPGAPSRMGEVASIRAALAEHFKAFDEIASPGSVDGGDVCETEDRIFVGISGRTNIEGAEQLAAFVEKLGRHATFVDMSDVDGMLHLKSGMAYLGDGRFVVAEELGDKLGLPREAMLSTAPDESYGANCIRVNDYVMVATGHPKLEADLKALGYKTLALDMSEYRKMDGGLSCLSLRF